MTEAAETPAYSPFLDDVQAFEQAVLAQEQVTPEHYDDEYFAADWREEGNRYELETRRRVEDRNPALIKEVFEPARVLVSALAGMLRPLHKALSHLDQQIQHAMDQHPDAALVRSWPGAGPALAPRLLVAFGTHRERFGSATEVAQFYGIAPVVQQSGNTKTVHMRHRCPKFGRQTFHENAACALKKEPWAKCFYENHKNRHDGKHHQACRALAYKLVRIYFRCWKDRKPYQPDQYLQALQKHGSPLHKSLADQPQSPCE